MPWPPGFPNPSLADEAALLPLLLRGPRGGWKAAEPPQAKDLPAARLEAIGAACAARGVRLSQALSLRASLLHSAHPSLFGGALLRASSAGAARFEDVVGAYLRQHGAQFLTQEDQTRAWREGAVAAGEKGPAHPPATPDFLFPSGLAVEGAVIHWMEVKRFYGAGSTDSLQKWHWLLKLHAQVEKYCRAFGPHGAILFSDGCSARTRGLLPPTVLALDGGPLEAALKEADRRAGAE